MNKKAYVVKFIIAIVAVMLLSAIAVAAYKMSYTRYGAVYYYGQPYYSYYPVYNAQGMGGAYYPSTYYNYPAYSNPYYYEPNKEYAYGFRSTYLAPELARNSNNMPCGLISTVQVGCEFGLYCDYSKGDYPGVGMCSRITATTTYPYQMDTSTPYYYG